jgi:3-oxoadipate enol-lactonase
MEKGAALQTGFADVNGTRFYYETAGQGHPLVLIHGLNLDTRMWDSQFFEFAQSYHVIRFDLRGMGQTKMTDDPYSLHGDIYALLKSLGIDKAYVAGLSLGGMAAMEFALAHPEMVDGLVLVSAGLLGHPRTEKRLRDIQRFNEVCKPELRREAVEMTVQMWFDGPDQPPNTSAAEARELFRRLTEHAYSLPDVNNVPQWLSPPPIERLEEILVPTLVIAGDRDYEDYLQIADVFERRIPGAKKVVMQGSAHIPPMDQPELFNRIVLEFLEGLKEKR